MPAQQPTSVAIEQLLHQAAAPLSIDQIVQATGFAKEKVRNVIRNLIYNQRVKRHGSTQKATYSMVAKYRCDIGELTPAKAKPNTPAAPKPTAEVVYPPGFKVTHCPSPGYQRMQPTNWHHARPEGRQHENLLSRRGNEFKPHQPPLHMCVGQLKDKASSARE